MPFSRRVVVLLLLVISLSVVQANPLVAVRTSIVTASSVVIHRFRLIFNRIPQVFHTVPVEWTAPSNEPSTEQVTVTSDIQGDQILALYNVMQARWEGDQVSKSPYQSVLFTIKGLLPYLWRSDNTPLPVVDDLLSGLASKLDGTQTDFGADKRNTADNLDNIEDNEKEAVGVGSRGVHTSPESKSERTVGAAVLGSIAGAARNAKRAFFGPGSREHTKLEQIMRNVQDAESSVVQETDFYKRVVADWASDRRMEFNSKEMRDYVGSLWKEAKEYGYEGLGLKRRAKENLANAQYRKSFTEAGKQVRKRLEIVSTLVRNTVWDSWDEDTHKVVMDAMRALTKLDKELLENRDEIVKEIAAISEPYTNEVRKGSAAIMKELRATQNPLVKQWANEVLRVLSNSLSPEVKQMLLKHFEVMRSAFQAETDAAQVLLDGIINSELFQSFKYTKSALSTCRQDAFCIVGEWVEQVLRRRLFVGLTLCIVLYFIDVFFDVSDRMAGWMEAKFKEPMASKFQRRTRNVNFGDRLSVEEIGPSHDSSDRHQADDLSVGDKIVPMKIRADSRSRELRSVNQVDTSFLGHTEERQAEGDEIVPMDISEDSNKRSGNTRRSLPPAEEHRTPSNVEFAEQGLSNNGNSFVRDIRSATDEVGEVQPSGSQVAKKARSAGGSGPSTSNNERRTTPRRTARKKADSAAPNRRSSRFRLNEN